MHQLSTRFSETGAFFAPRLINPAVDAKAVAATLKRLGFELAEGYELAFQQMRSILSQFSAALQDAKGAVVYHAGHGASLSRTTVADLEPPSPQPARRHCRGLRRGPTGD
ncbi:MAG TPA: caspase family protein [Roseiarcus sp.]|nr:caspase family protein [Roseiarcus sp.]